MAPVTGVELSNSQNKSFQANAIFGMLLEANQQLQNGPVAPGASGYAAYKKRMDLATNVINNPKIYAEAFCREMLVFDTNACFDVDSTSMQNRITSNNIRDKIAGVNAQDLV